MLHLFRPVLTSTLTCVGLLALLGGCVHTAAAPASGEWITSDASQYSPVARFRTHAEIAPREIRIAVDSGSLYIPGEVIPNAPPLMSNLYLTAILAVPDSNTMAVVRAAAGRAPAERRAWRPIATSDSVPLVKELRYGERAAIPAMRLTLPSVTLPAGPAWIIYRITGDGVELQAPMVAGGQPRRRDLPGGVRVYACAERDVRGSADPSRAASLREAYGIAC